MSVLRGATQDHYDPLVDHKSCILRSNDLYEFITDCGSPPTVPNGVFSGDTFYTGTASVSCNPGYDGSGPAVCGATGAWTTFPTCFAKGIIFFYIFSSIINFVHQVPHVNR